MPEVRVCRARLVSLLILLLPIACSEAPQERDPLLDYVMTARSLSLDSGTATEQLLQGDSLADFLGRFERDTFRPGPRSVRIESECRPGALRIGRKDHPVALCTVYGGRGRIVMSVDLDTMIVRLVQR